MTHAIESLYIDGRRVDATSGETFPVVNPYDGSTLAEVQQASEADVDAAVAAAAAASASGPP